VSGGSYDYLCWHTDDLSARRYAVEEMAERLEGSGYYGAARATRNVLLLIDGAKRAADALEDVWYAVEWADSGDSGEDAVREAVAKLEPWPPE
jgi:hypothetical protein